MASFARRKTTGTERPLHYVRDLATLQRQHLPECLPVGSPLTTIKARDWRTVRLRPEVLTILDGLCTRTRHHFGNGELGINEVLSAVILAGLPDVLSRSPFKVD